VRRHEKASTAGSIKRRASRPGRFFRGAFAILDASGDAKGSGAPTRVHTHKRGQLRLLLSLAAAALSLGALLLFTAPALAGTVSERPLLFSFDGSDTTAGAFTAVQRLGIDQATGAVYVMDTGHDVIDKFNSSGVAANFSATGASSLSGSGTPESSFGLNGDGDISVDNSGGATQGQIYVNRENGPIDAFSPSGAYLWQLGEGLFHDDCGTAVDAAGHLWVGNYGTEEAAEYDNTGSPPAQIGSVTSTTGRPCRLNLDASGNLFFNMYSSEVDKYVGGVFSSTLDSGSNADVAIDQSSATGHLFTIHSGDFNEYESSGALISAYGENLIGNGRGIAYNKALDRVYVADASTDTVKVFGPAVIGTVPDLTIEASSEIGVSKAKFNGKVNPQSVPNSYFFEWKEGTGASWSGAESSSPQVLPEDNSDHAVSFNATGLSGNTTYQVRLVGTNTENNLRSASSPDTFTTAAAVAPAVTIAAPSVTLTSTEVSGTVNPKEDFDTTWHLQLSTDPACASGFSNQTIHKLESEANSPLAVSEELTGLLANQHYCVRIRATNSGGTTTSEVKEFTTEPVPPTQVFTAFAAPRTDTTARLNGRANPQGANSAHPLTYRFEYSEDSGATWIPLGDHEYSGGAHEQIVLADELTGLSPNTTYSFRFIAEDDAGSASPQGEVKTFTTRTVAEMNPPARGIELVNNPDKGNQRVWDVEVPARGTSRISADGEKAIWSVTGGAPGGTSSTGATFLAKRTASGWKSTNLVPPASEQVGGGDFRYTLEATTPDFTKFIFTAALSKVFNPLPDEPVVVRTDDSGNQDVLKRLDVNNFLAEGAIDLTDDGSHVLIEDPVTEQIEDIGSGVSEPVSVMPDGSPVECFGGTLDNGLRLGQWHPDYHVISTIDGSRLYFDAKPNSDCSKPYGLYVRNRESEETTLIDPGTFGQSPEILRATPNGRIAYFITSSQLDPADGNFDRDIYRWSEESGESICMTCEATPDAKVGSEAMVSDDFSHVYFESTAQLVPGLGQSGDINLYALSGGALKFVADPNLTTSDVLAKDTARLSSDGNVLLFGALSRPALTADALAPECIQTNGGVETLAPCKQLYRYDDRDGSLECISCRQDGVTTYSYPGESAILNFSQTLSGDGSSAAFTTWEALLPLDVNNDNDIYEWRNGDLRLITDGLADQPTIFSSPMVFNFDRDGSNLLFSEVPPRGKLTGFEQDSQVNLYDARIGGGFEPPSPSPHCSEESCQGPLQPAPRAEQPSSSTFNGAGNQEPQAKKRPCVRKHGKAKRRCIRAHHRQSARAKANGGRAK
jgi:hypothetical protein